MFYAVALLAGAAALARAQVTYNSTTGVYTCPANNPNGAFCAGDSLATNIIIRCTNGVGQPGNCNDNLAGYFPIGVNYAPCWQSSPTSGNAACSKNCIVEGSSGNFNGTFVLPNCTPQSSSSSSASTAAPTSPAASTATSYPASSTITSTGTTTYSVGSVTSTQTFTTTYCPGSSSVAPPPVSYSSVTFSSYSVIPPPLSTGTGSGNGGSPSNGTSTGASGSQTSGSATATPISPTTVPVNGAMPNAAAPGLAAIGLFAAYFL